MGDEAEAITMLVEAGLLEARDGNPDGKQSQTVGGRRHCPKQRNPSGKKAKQRLIPVRLIPVRLDLVRSDLYRMVRDENLKHYLEDIGCQGAFAVRRDRHE